MPPAMPEIDLEEVQDQVQELWSQSGAVVVSTAGGYYQVGREAALDRYPHLADVTMEEWVNIILTVLPALLGLVALMGNLFACMCAPCCGSKVAPEDEAPLRPPGSKSSSAKNGSPQRPSSNGGARAGSTPGPPSSAKPKAKPKGSSKNLLKA